jgi:photosystem II stability/assembly factor-like uncharacterized protein
MPLRPYRWLHALTGLCLGVCLAVPVGAQAPAAPVTEKRPIPTVVQKKLEKKLKQTAQGPLRYDKPEEAQEYLRLRRAPAGQKEVPVERYLAALETMRTMPQYSTSRRSVLPTRAALEKKGLSYANDASSLGGWTGLGPGNIGGRTRALVINPEDARMMYAAGVAGGVWKTTNGGASWTPLGDFLPNIAVNSLAISPKNANVIYAGTGEAFFNGDAIRGAGIFKSIDAGATWKQVASGTPFHYVADIVVSASRPSRVYAATRTGVWRSLDAGATWNQVLQAPMFGGCLDLVMRTDRAADHVFASCGNFDQAIVYRNTAAHAGGEWKSVLSDPGMGRTTLAIAPSNQNVLYALAASNVAGNFQDGLHGVFRSANGGTTWTAQVRNNSPRRVDTLLLSNPIIATLVECFGDTGNIYLNQGWYDNTIAVDPKDPNRVWAGGIDLFRSDDAGKSWGVASYWWAQLNDGTYLPTYAHADQHIIVFHPRYNGTTNQTMFVGNDGGIYKTRNARAAVVKGPEATCDPFAGQVLWENLNNGYAVTQFYYGLPYPDGTAFLGGTQDNGTLRGSEATGTEGWTEVFGGDGGFVAIDSENPDTIYVSTPGLALRKSTNGGQTFAPAIDGIEESPGNFLFVTPFVMDPSNSDRLWIGGSQLWRTDNGAESWSAASRPVAGERFPIISAIAVSPTDSNRVMAGTVEGFVHRSETALTDTGDTRWRRNKPRDGYITWIAYDPQDPNVAYVTYASFGGGAHIWKTANGGATWSPLDGTGAGTLPDIPVNAIVVDPADSSRLYAGTDMGVFSSTDGGQTWMVENTNFANVPVWAMSIQAGVGGERTLYAFTHGRGAWRVRLP